MDVTNNSCSAIFGLNEWNPLMFMPFGTALVQIELEEEKGVSSDLSSSFNS